KSSTLSLHDALPIYNRNDQAPFRPDGDPDVVEIILNEIVSFDSPIDRGNRLQRRHRRFNEEGHETKFQPILFSELLLGVSTQGLHLAHVAFVEGRQDRSGMLRHDQLLRDLPAQW